MAEFNETTVGYSFNKAEEYLENLNNELIDETIKLIENKRASVEKVLDECWTGQACSRFKSSFQVSTKELGDTLKYMKTTMSRVVATLEEEMVKRDKSIVGGLE